MLSNNIKVVLFFFLLITSVVNNSLFAKNEIPVDSSNIQIRKLNESQQQELLTDNDYKYNRVSASGKTWWDRFWDWFFEMIAKLFEKNESDSFLNFSIGEIIVYSLSIAVLVLLIILLVKSDLRALFYGKSASVKIDFSELEEDIHKINFDDLIAEALAKKDYKKAIRLHFLKLLKELTDKNLINWKIDKTNNDYLIELSNSSFKNQFKDLALTYEYVWYGDFHLDEPNFKSTLTKFQSFKV